MRQPALKPILFVGLALAIGLGALLYATCFTDPFVEVDGILKHQGQWYIELAIGEKEANEIKRIHINDAEDITVWVIRKNLQHNIERRCLSVSWGFSTFSPVCFESSLLARFWSSLGGL